MSSSSCELILKFELSTDESPDGPDDVQMVPALCHLSLGYVHAQRYVIFIVRSKAEMVSLIYRTVL